MRYSREQLIDRIRQTARSIGFPEQVAIAQLARESANFRDDVVYGPFVGGSGERGLAQFIPGTWARFGAGMHQTAYDPDASLAAWASYTTYLSSLFGGDLVKILQGYNGGEGNVQRGTVSSAARRYASEILAQAGQVSNAAPSSITGGNSLFDFDSWGWKQWAMVGVAGLLLFALLDD